MKGRIFVSSVQEELAEERRAVRNLLRDDPLLSRFFEALLQEDRPARDRRADGVHLAEVERAAVYVGLFGDEYGAEHADGKSATEREFERASERGKPRLIFVKGADPSTRHPKTRALLDKAGAQLARRRFGDVGQLVREVRFGLLEHLLHTGQISSLPFDAAACPDATLEDLSPEKVRWFLDTGRRERTLALEENVPIEVALTHLNLLDHGLPSRAAVLLFARAPQRFLPSSEVKCTHYAGSGIEEPLHDHVYQGTLFDLVDQVLEFVRSKPVRAKEKRGPRAPAEHELPRRAVAEAIVNAVAHRDYSTSASVQVSLFADRLEVRSPGELPSTLSLADLRRPHASVPRNPLLSEPLFLARHGERAGSGTLEMLAQCRAAELSEPEFRQEAGEFVVTLWRQRVTAAAPGRPALGERKRKAVAPGKKKASAARAGKEEDAGRTSPPRSEPAQRRAKAQRSATGRRRAAAKEKKSRAQPPASARARKRAKKK